MSIMQFLPQLALFLKIHGTIYTVRGFYYRVSGIEVEGVGNCKRKFIAVVYCTEDLEKYVPLSGFDSVKDWWLAIRNFTRSGGKLYLYKVTVVK